MKPHRDRKIDYAEVRRLLFEEKLTGREVAQRLRVSPGWISRIKNDLSIAKSTVVLQSARKIQHQEFRAEDRILKIDEVTQQSLDHVTQRLATSTDKDERSWLEAQLKFIEESRKQISMWADVHRTILYRQELEKFKDTVLTAIGKAAPEVKNEILRELNAASLAGSVLSGVERSV